MVSGPIQSPMGRCLYGGQLPETISPEPYLTGIAEGLATLKRVDDMTIRQVTAFYYAGLDNGKAPAKASSHTEYRNVRGNHSVIIKRVSREAIVLLKDVNKGGGGLPLRKPRSMALFGAHAGPVLAGPNAVMSVIGTPSETYPGHLATTLGSGEDSVTFLVDPYLAIAPRAVEGGTMIKWIFNNTYIPHQRVGIPSGFTAEGFGFDHSNHTDGGGKGMGKEEERGPGM
jgi:beta-glucosidase